MEDFERISWLRYPSSLYFLERHKLRVKQATEPTNVVFEVVKTCVCNTKNVEIVFFKRISTNHFSTEYRVQPNKKVVET